MLPIRTFHSLSSHHTEVHDTLHLQARRSVVQLTASSLAGLRVHTPRGHQIGALKPTPERQAVAACVKGIMQRVRLREECRAATLLQAAWRGYKARAAYHQLRSSAGEGCAAWTLHQAQPRISGKPARAHYQGEGSPLAAAGSAAGDCLCCSKVLESLQMASTWLSMSLSEHHLACAVQERRNEELQASLQEAVGLRTQADRDITIAQGIRDNLQRDLTAALHENAERTQVSFMHIFLQAWQQSQCIF